MVVFTPKTVRPPSDKVISPSKERGPIRQSFKDAKSKGKMVKFLYYRQMVSYLQVLVRSLMRKQTLKFLYYRQMVSYLQVLVRSLMRKKPLKFLYYRQMVSYLQVLVRSLMRKQPLKFLYYRQMVSYLQVLVRSLMRKQTLEVSLLPSNGILPPSAGKKFDEETNP